MRSLVVTLGLLLGTIPLYAATSVADYKARMEAAISTTDTLLAKGHLHRSAVDKVKLSIPQTEIIEENGDRIETANAWLHLELERYLLESDAATRASILTATRERLVAIVRSIDELESAKTAATKDADRQKLGEILSRPEFQRPNAQEESLFQKWMRQVQEWFERSFPRPAVSPQISPSMGSLRLWLQVLVFALIIGLVGFLIYRFVPGFFGGRRKRVAHDGDRIILGERIADDRSASDLFTEAEHLAQKGELRAAIRKGYIALLVELADRKVIALARHKTNRDYLRDVGKRQEIFDGVSGLTSNFERNWYGLTSATEGDWQEFRQRYQETMRNV